uniref:Craniofacial development protein 2 n=1 Tax=Cacopsylla melanoneura TaxID=428564 RepID=A0A8D9EQY8_9HEMI
MACYKTNLDLPQVSRGVISESHPREGCLMDSGGGAYAINQNRNQPNKKNKKIRNKESNITYATWNVRTLLDSANNESNSLPRRTAMIAKELKSYKIDIAALQETHLKGSGRLDEVGEGYTYYWSGCEENDDNHYGVALCIKTKLIQKGAISDPICVNDRMMYINIEEKNITTTLICCYAPTLQSEENTKNEFYAKLNEICDTIPPKNKLIITGDFNARVGEDHETWKGILGKHGTGKLNSNGQLLLEFCAARELKIANTTFYLKRKFKTTWQHPRSKEWHLIDFILVRKQDIKNVIRCRVMRGADCGTDHRLIRSVMKGEIKKYHAPKKNPPTYDHSSLKDTHIKRRFQEKLMEQNNILPATTDLEETWEAYKTNFTVAIQNTVPKKRSNRRDWFDENTYIIDNIVVAKKQAHEILLSDPHNKNKVEKYKNAHKNSQQQIRQIKNDWWSTRAKEMQEYMDKGDSFNLYRAIKAVVGPVYKSLNLIEDQHGNLLTDKTKRLNRWNEYFESIYNQHNDVDLNALPIKTKDLEEVNDETPSEEEVTRAVSEMKNNKSPGIDNITADIIKAGEGISVDMLTHLLSLVWNQKRVPDNWKEAVVVPIHKKASKYNCNNYRGISLLSVPGKILSRIIYC